MRVLAFLMVICEHSFMPSGNANGMVLGAFTYLTNPSIGLFFVISGALLLPIKLDTKSFICKRLSKVIYPTLIFTFIYLVLNIIVGKKENLWVCVLSIPFSAQGSGVLWFMYTITGLYLVAPIISKWLEAVSKKELEFYLGLWAITLCYPILKVFIAVNDSSTGILFNFSGFLGYFVLGYYLRKYPDSLPFGHVSILAIICLVMPFVVMRFKQDADLYSIFGFLSIFCAVLTVFLYKLCMLRTIRFKNGRGSLKNVLILTSNLSFGIYLVHIAVMRFFLWRIDFIVNINNYLLQWATVVVLTFGISWIVTYFISFLPFGDYIIGYKQKS